LYAQQNNSFKCDSNYYTAKPEGTIFHDFLFNNDVEPIKIIEWGKLENSTIKRNQFSFQQNSLVWVEFIVDTIGVAHCIKVFKSDNNQFNSPAIEIITNSQFSPARKNKVKIISRTILPVRFKK